MKSEVNKAGSMHNYNIKAKHMGTMSNFFASKNFELHTRMPTPPPDPSKDPKAASKTPAAGAKKGLNSGNEIEQRRGSQASVDSEAMKVLVVKENIENDEVELVKQIESSWAQR